MFTLCPPFCVVCGDNHPVCHFTEFDSQNPFSAFHPVRWYWEDQRWEGEEGAGKGRGIALPSRQQAVSRVLLSCNASENGFPVRCFWLCGCFTENQWQIWMNEWGIAKFLCNYDSYRIPIGGLWCILSIRTYVHSLCYCVCVSGSRVSIHLHNTVVPNCTC